MWTTFAVYAWRCVHVQYVHKPYPSRSLALGLWGIGSGKHRKGYVQNYGGLQNNHYRKCHLRTQRGS